MHHLFNGYGKASLAIICPWLLELGELHFLDRTSELDLRRNRMVLTMVRKIQKSCVCTLEEVCMLNADC